MSVTHKNIANQRFGRLVALERVEDRITKSGRKIIQYKCRCDCGNEKVVDARHLKDGSIISCGCYLHEMLIENGKRVAKKPSNIHHLINSRIYRIWGNMVNRCTNINNPAFGRYGGRNITVCDEWKDSFETFYEWAKLSGYNDNLTIDRIDNNSGYAPDNCRWVNRYVQANNKRNNILYCYDGKTLTLSEISRMVNIPYKTLHRRINTLGWDFEKAINEKVQTHRRS